MRIQLETDSNDKVTGATFGITPGDFKRGKEYYFKLSRQLQMCDLWLPGQSRGTKLVEPTNAHSRQQGES